MEENNAFVSCMKIRGISILPPLITPERRKELLEYKKKALLLEESYQKKRSQSDISEGNFTKYVETEMRIITSASDQSLPLENFLEDVTSKYVPYERKDKTNLSIDITNVYDCIPLEEVRLNCANEIIENRIPQKLEDSCKPRLIRSNSYTLDNPSSILLDHLKRQSSSSCDQTLNSNENTEDFKSPQQNSHILEETKTILFDTENVQESSLNIAKNKTIDTTEKYHSNTQPSFEVITTDITVQQINFTTPDNNNGEATNTLSAIEIPYQKPIVKEDDLSSSTDPEIELNAILQQIPEDYAKKIMQLITEQKKEQQRRTQNYEYIKTEMLQSGDFDNKNLIQVSSPKRIFVTSASNSQPNILKNKMVDCEVKKDSERTESSYSHCAAMEKSLSSSLNESQTLPFDMSTSSSDSLDDFSLRTIRVLELERDSLGNITKFNQKNPLLPKETISSKDVKDVVMASYDMNKFKEREMQRIREEKAASIIGAYAKGYLVRRLMSTAKVKTIIQTIQDALVCALELQRSETIEEADVELHRRLIKLVSSACFEFHDIFFALTIPEQMDIIAIDREKVKRTMAIRTTHSSTDFRSRGRKLSNIRSSQSLTKI